MPSAGGGIWTSGAVPRPRQDGDLMGFTMAWVVLFVSGVMEAVWATALGKAAGFTRLYPSIVFFVALVLSMAGLGYATRTLPTGTAYAVWVGVGAVLTVGYAMATGEEPITALKVAFLGGIVVCVVGLKVLD